MSRKGAHAATVPPRREDIEELGLAEAAVRARHEQIRLFRENAEREARRRVARELAIEPTEFFYREDVGIGVPIFKYDGLLISVSQGQPMCVIEPCGECDGNPRGWGFTDLPGLGEMLEEMADAHAHVCPDCASEIAHAGEHERVGG